MPCLTCPALLNCCSMSSRTIEGENSTTKRRTSIEAVLVTASSDCNVTSIAFKMPKAFSLLKKESRPGGCNA